ncbi:MAG: aspartate-semialdehyde dehydrogenase [Alphaproteobacteria bacterium]|nr:MAG: aspartate-semialdehyde dehydrogenase [Alphaproteobacteria bacterium]
MSYTIAVVGATGNVGREVLNILAERNFPAKKIHALASEKSAGREVAYGDDKSLRVESLSKFDFKGVDIVFSAAGSSVSKEFVPRATAAGAIVIDKTSLYRMEPDVPLVVPEVNPQALAGYAKRRIIAVPNCSTIQIVMALKPLHDIARIKRVVVATYQSVGGAGKEAMDELFNQTRNVFVSQDAKREIFSKQIAFNLIPHIDSFMDDGYTKEEWKMMAETKKILDPKIEVVATCVRVPVFVGHSEAINVEFESQITVKQARDALEKFPGIEIVDRREDEGYITPIECVGQDEVFISRLRSDKTVPFGLSFWCVSDNLRKGAALNAVQIAESLIEQKMLKAA